MALLLAAMLLASSGVEPTEDVVAAAEQAGVDSVDLQGALNTTHLEPLEYLYRVGHLQRPVPKPTGRLACIAWVESRNDPNATNPRSKAAGLYQFLWSTWATTPQGKAGQSPYDPVAATEAAEWMVRAGRVNEWVAVSGGFC